MDASRNNGHRKPTWGELLGSWFWRPADPLIEAQVRLESVKREKLRKLTEQQAKLLEDDQLFGDFFAVQFAQMMDLSSQQFGDFPFFIGTYTDRQYGRHWPEFLNESQLGIMRIQARMLYDHNSYAHGIISGICSYVIGTGFTYRAISDESPELAEAVQDEIDQFIEVNNWNSLEQDLFVRSRVDGEFFLRYHENDDGVLIIREIEPEKVRQEPGGDYRHFSFGIDTDPEDVVEVKGYWVYYSDTAAAHQETGEYVDADDVLHYKINVTRTVKRGISDLWGTTYTMLFQAAKLAGNLGQGAAIQAAIAQIQQWETATMAQVQSFVDTTAEFTQRNPFTGTIDEFRQSKAGTTVNIPRGMQFVPPPGWQSGVVESMVEILHALLRGACQKWNAPEWMATSSGADMAAYTASLTAESPFVRSAERYQHAYEQVFLKVIKRAVKVAIQAGRLPPDALKLVDIQCEGPEIAARNELQEAQANTARVQGGWKSRQTIAQEEGLDWPVEQANMQEYQDDMQDAGGLPMPGENNGEEDGNGNGNGNGVAKQSRPPLKLNSDKQPEGSLAKQGRPPLRLEGVQESHQIVQNERSSVQPNNHAANQIAIVLDAVVRLLASRKQHTAAEGNVIKKSGE